MSERKIPTTVSRLSRQEMNPRGGCLCKLPGLDLSAMIAAAVEWASQDGLGIRPPAYPEDCAIIEVDGSRLLLTTELTPIVGIDLYVAGRIAALHAMSDIYASGGIPKWALVNLVIKDGDPEDYSVAVLAGIMAQCAIEGAEVVGGHTIVGSEAMAGLALIGASRPGRILRKKGARPGDVLLLSKPLGVGLILRGYKLGLLNEHALNTAVSAMLTSNASASAAAFAEGVHASTDVTGFGMLGHLTEMLEPGIGAIIEMREVPVLLQAKTLPDHSAQTIWIKSNYQYATAQREILSFTTPEQLSVLLDPQTNGGLLVSSSEAVAEALQVQGFTRIGHVTDSPTVVIRE